MLWTLSFVFNSVVAACFAMIAYTVYTGLKSSGQLKSNMLGVATAAMFGSCAISHESHAFHMLMPYFGIEVQEGLAMRRAVVWHLDLVDAGTMIVSVWYWTLRPRFKNLLDGGVLFTDLQRRYEKLQSKGRVADALQRALAPKELPGASAVAFDATYVAPQNEANIGGDWYDVFNLPDGRIAFSIGDVTGHGLDAAAAMSRAREIIAAAAFAIESPAAVLEHANRILLQRTSPIVTAIYGTIEPNTLSLTYATAGHPPPILAFRDEAATFCDYDGLPLAVERDATYVTFAKTLRRGALLVVYTDGVIEFSRNLAEGEERLLGSVSRHAALSTASPSQPILDEVLGGRKASDDIALLAIKFIGDPVIRDFATGRTWTFDVKDAEAATRLRREITACIDAHAFTTDPFASELISGELLSNVVRHTPGIIEVSLDWGLHPAVLAVEDKGNGFVPTASLPTDDYSENGRGMFLITTLARGVRVVPNDAGGSRIEVALPALRPTVESGLSTNGAVHASPAATETRAR
ncbi:MAG: hypothetical protein NVS2B17_16940 [Candidatus Velthaea sp.]